MRKLLAWLVVTLGIAALLRRLRRGAGSQPAAEPQTVDDPAAELRLRLAEARAAEASPEPGETRTVEDRRSEVHEQGRAALDEMRPPDES